MYRDRILYARWRCIYVALFTVDLFWTFNYNFPFYGFPFMEYSVTYSNAHCKGGLANKLVT